MSIFFPGATDQAVDLGDITDAQYRHTSAWSSGAFFSIKDSADDDRSIISKWKTDGSDERPFLIRTDLDTTPPTNMEVFSNGTAGMKISGGDVIELNTWYFVVVTNTAASALTLYTLSMSGQFLDDGLTDTSQEENAYGASIEIGGETVNGQADEMHGHIQYPFYVKHVLTKEEVLAALTDPIGVLAAFGWDLVFLLDMGHGGTPTVNNLSPRGRNLSSTGISLKGGPLLVGPDPPSLIDRGDFLFAKAAAAAVSGAISLAGAGGLAGSGGIAGLGGGLAGYHDRSELSI